MGRLDDAQKKQLLLQALDGLGYAHSQRIVHRDIKPENLFVTRAGQLKIADFGIAKGVADPSITQSGSMGGTPYYISPEQITDFRNVDYRTDMYALGVLAYELFTGRVPFDHPSLTQLLLAHLEAPPTPMRAFRPELPEALDALVLRLLQKVPRDRFESCAETRDALARIEL
jgi:serine/threonine-protein kinase